MYCLPRKAGSLIAIAFLLSITACKRDPMDHLYGEIKKAGYIAFKTPLEKSGTGTMIGGKPDRLSLIAHPETCFPKNIEGIPTELRRYDKTTLPYRKKRISVSGNSKFKLAEFFSVGNPVISAGASFSHVHTMSVDMKGIHVEYIDSIALKKFYKNQMSDICKDFLDRVGFVIQAIKVDELEFRFYRKNGAAIEIKLDNIEQVVDIEAGIKFSIENEVGLKIKTPKYIGYQLGRLLRSDDGEAFYRSSRTHRNKFVFEKVDLFGNDDAIITKSAFMKRLFKLDYAPMQREPSLELFKELSNEDFIDVNRR